MQQQPEYRTQEQIDLAVEQICSQVEEAIHRGIVSSLNHLLTVLETTWPESEQIRQKIEENL